MKKDKSEVERFFDQYAKDYTYDDLPPGAMRFADDITWHFIVKYLPKNLSAKILDAGAGEGYWSQNLIEIGYKNIVLLDISQSMGQGLIRNTKLEFSIRACVLLAHMAQERKDIIGIATFNNWIRTFTKPGQGSSHLNRILEDLAYAMPNGPSYMTRAVQELIMRTRSRGLLFIISDLEGKRKDI